MNRHKANVEKQRHWAGLIREAACSGTSIREFCRQRRIKESQFYWWQRRLRERREARTLRQCVKTKGPRQAATFALVSEEPGQLDAGIELVLADGRRVRINRGVDEETLRTVLNAMGSRTC
jgi:transposase-like protein